MMNSQQARLAPTATPDDNALLSTTMEAASPMRQQSNAARHFINQMKARLSAYECGFEAGFQDDLLLGLAQASRDGRPDHAVRRARRPCVLRSRLDLQEDRRQSGLDSSRPTPASSSTTAFWPTSSATRSASATTSPPRPTPSTTSTSTGRFASRVTRRAASRATVPGRPAYGSTTRRRDDGRIDEWSYSSVMDYKGLNEDAHGLGRYDTRSSRTATTTWSRPSRPSPTPTRR